MAAAWELVGTWTETASPGARVSVSGIGLEPSADAERTCAMKFLADLGLHQRAAGARTLWCRLRCCCSRAVLGMVGEGAEAGESECLAKLLSGDNDLK